ncbi:macro domain-containing protein [Vibrio harveyi]|uniref:macro domain-containing protein n=1 Tax=Vibrio harveyi TaxID=669 RepID=UPI003CED0546
MFDLNLGYCNGGSYAGVGSRRIAVWFTKQQIKFGAAMAFMGVKLNSGAADGSDTAYEFGAKLAYDYLANKYGLPALDYKRVMSIYLPWEGFNGRNSVSGFTSSIHPAAEAVASRYHDYWDGLKYGPKKMMSRNSMQVLGEDLNTPVRFVMAYTPDAAINAQMTSSKSGGTGQAIRIATDKGINVYNIANPQHWVKVEQWLKDIETKIEAKFDVNLSELVEECYKSYNPFPKTVSGDAVQMLLNGEADTLIHGCNCHHTMGAGIAKQIRMAFPEAYQADLQTVKGDRKKLGTYSKAEVERDGRKIKIINAYTQYRFGNKETELYADYESIRKSMEAIAENEQTGRIVVPSIGAGLANGCWVTISNSITNALKGHDLTHVEFSKTPERELVAQQALF